MRIWRWRAWSPAGALPQSARNSRRLVLVCVSILRSPSFDRALPPENRSVAGKTVDANSNVTTGAILSSVVARSAPSDLFDLLESKPVWKIEELEQVLEISAKTLYKQAARGKLPSFRIGSCVRVYGKGLADHLRGKMKK